MYVIVRSTDNVATCFLIVGIYSPSPPHYLYFVNPEDEPLCSAEEPLQSSAKATVLGHDFETYPAALRLLSLENGDPRRVYIRDEIRSNLRLIQYFVSNCNEDLLNTL